MSGKGAMSSGGGKANSKAKDSAMAAMLKKRGIVRRVMACAICHGTVPMAGYEGHLMSCKGRRRAVG